MLLFQIEVPRYLTENVFSFNFISDMVNDHNWSLDRSWYSVLGINSRSAAGPSAGDGSNVKVRDGQLPLGLSRRGLFIVRPIHRIVRMIFRVDSDVRILQTPKIEQAIQLDIFSTRQHMNPYSGIRW